MGLIGGESTIRGGVLGGLRGGSPNEAPPQNIFRGLIPPSRPPFRPPLGFSRALERVGGSAFRTRRIAAAGGL